jgi:lysophospholipase L1-like esterase
MKSKRILVIIIGVLILALTISIALNFFLFNQGQQYYYQLNLTYLDPLGLSVYPPQSNEIANSEKLRVIFFGDSRAYQWPKPPNLDQFEFINRGIGAQTSTQVVERFDEHVVPLHPDILLIQMCINDLKTIPLFPHLKSWIISNCKDNLKWSVGEARKQGATVILTTIFPLGKVPLERRLFWSDDVGQAIAEVNEFIYSLAEEKVIIFDTGEVLADEKGMVREEYSGDLLHLSEAGYEALNRKLVDILNVLGHTQTAHMP